MTNKIEALVLKVREMAAKYPDARYQAAAMGCECYNGKGVVAQGPKTEGCIIGQCVRRLEPDKFDNAKGSLSSSQTLKVIGYWNGEYSDDDYAPYVRWLSLVQRDQDMGATWSEAVKDADRKLLQEYPDWVSRNGFIPTTHS